MRMGMFASCRDIRMGGVMSKFAARTSVACAAALQRRAGLHPAVSRGKRVRIPPRHMDRRVLILPSCKASGFAFHCVVLTSRFASYNAVRQASLRTATPHGQASSHPAKPHGKRVCVLPRRTDRRVLILPRYTASKFASYHSTRTSKFSSLRAHPSLQRIQLPLAQLVYREAAGKADAARLVLGEVQRGQRYRAAVYEYLDRAGVHEYG